MVPRHPSTLEDKKSSAVVGDLRTNDRFVFGETTKITRPQRQVFRQPPIDLKAPSHAACISQWMFFDVHEFARSIENRLAILCVSCDDPPGEVGLRIDSQSGIVNH